MKLVFDELVFYPIHEEDPIILNIFKKLTKKTYQINMFGMNDVDEKPTNHHTINLQDLLKTFLTINT